jgi:hypothetical protein
LGIINEEIGKNCLECIQRRTWNKEKKITTNLNNQDSFINMCKKLSTEILGPNSFKDQEIAMDKGMELPNDKKLHDTLEQYTIIKRTCNFLEKKASPSMKLKYVKLGGDTVDNKKAIVVAMDKLDTHAKMSREITELDQKAEEQQ